MAKRNVQRTSISLKKIKTGQLATQDTGEGSGLASQKPIAATKEDGAGEPDFERAHMTLPRDFQMNKDIRQVETVVNPSSRAFVDIDESLTPRPLAVAKHDSYQAEEISGAVNDRQEPPSPSAPSTHSK